MGHKTKQPEYKVNLEFTITLFIKQFNKVPEVL